MHIYHIKMSLQSSNNIQMKTFGGKVGSVAVSTIDFNSWMNSTAVIATTKVKKTRGNKEIIHKIFSECAKILTDPFWIDKFNLAAIGKLPPKFYFNQEVLTYRKGAKCMTLIVSSNPHEAAIACIKFFHTNGGIFSAMDGQYAVDIQSTRIHSVLSQEKLSWEGASKKVKECLISHYINDQKLSMNLTSDKTEQLRQILRTGLFNGSFNKTNIRLENNRIYSIEGILWDGKLFYIHPDVKPTISRSYTKKKNASEFVDKDSIPQFSIKWDKYTDILEKKKLLNIQRQNRFVEQDEDEDEDYDEDDEEI